MKKKLLVFAAVVLTAISFCNAQNRCITSLSYSPSTFVSTGEDFHSVSLDVSSINPIRGHEYFCFEPGFGISGTFGKRFQGEYRSNLYFISFKLPLQVGYKIRLSDKDFIYPHMGCYARANLFGHYSIDDSNIDAFSKSKVGDAALKYVQAGYVYGVKIVSGRLCLGVSYERDVNNIAYNTKSASNKVSIGYMF